jgi:hypothetical protein
MTRRLSKNGLKKSAKSSRSSLAFESHGFKFMFGRHLIGGGGALHQVGVKWQHHGSISCVDDFTLPSHCAPRLRETLGKPLENAWIALGFH